MHDDIKAPVITSISRAQLASCLSFMDKLRVDNTAVAGLEAERLKPYLAAFAKQLKADIKNAKPEDVEQLKKMSSGAALRKLFNTVAKRSGNTILSEIVIAPEDLLKNEKVLKGNTAYNGKSSYDGNSFTLGFIQIFEKDEKRSTTLPLLAFNTGMMKAIEKHRPEKMLRHFQDVMSAGNHDMQHHYSNRALNPDISIASRQKEGLHENAYTILSWFRSSFKYYSDTDPTSYESWLMLNHQRVRRIMEQGAEGKKLKKSIDGFFDELDRIGRKLADAKTTDSAHETVDYFSTILGFALMRFMPLDHPVLEHALRRMGEADPAPEKIAQKAQELSIRTKAGGKYMTQTLANYKAHGLDLLPKEDNYVEVKRLQLVEMEAWNAHLLSPAQDKTELARVQKRVGTISSNMIKASALSAAFHPGSGKRHIKYRAKGGIEIWHKNDLLHRTDGPAYIETTSSKKARKERWFFQGVLHRKNGPAETITGHYDDEKTENWYRQGKLHRDGGPAVIETVYGGKKIETWYKNGIIHRDDGPAKVVINRDGVREETWYKNGIMGRDDGPAHIKIYSARRKSESWYKNEKLHRDSGPARIVTEEDGSTTETWYKHGKMHRDDSPAFIRKGVNGLNEERWFKDDMRHRIGGPACRMTDADGTIEEQWYENGLCHRSDGPAYIYVKKDGTREEIWYDRGRTVREKTGAPDGGFPAAANDNKKTKKAPLKPKAPKPK